MSGPRVLHEDERVLVLDKPCGQDVIPGRGTRALETLVEQARGHAAGKIFVVHRLDRETSGVVLFAKDAAAHRELSLAFEGRRVAKTYLALVRGETAAGGTVEASLREFGSGRIGVDPRGKPSLTRYRLLEKLHGATLLEVKPVTGRRHQIRAHLYHIGHPVLGDPRYGHAAEAAGAPRLMLHALELSFSLGDARAHARTVRAEPPADFLAILERFRKDG